MAVVTELKQPAPEAPGSGDLVAIVRALGPGFAANAAAADEGDVFVAKNYQALKDAGLIEAGVPKEFGGGGHDVAELCAMLRELAHHCSSTALAFAMHTHQVAIPAWRWVHQKAAPVEPLLKRLDEADVLLAVCTNKVERLSRQLLEQLGIDRYFPVVIGGDTLSVKKPDPEHLFEAVRLLGGDRNATIMVGDSETDIDAAKNAGMPSICVSFGYTRLPVTELGADIIIDHFDEFPRALATLMPAHFEGWR